MSSRTVSPAFAPLRVFGSSVIGPLHIKRDIPCQDACAYKTIGGRSALVAVADGLGSAARSDIGAHTAVAAALESGEGLLADAGLADIQSGLRDVLGAARNALEARAATDGCALRDLACTIIVLAIQETAVSVAHIGDGAVVGETPRGLQLISGPGESEYANEVTPLTGADWEQALRIASRSNDFGCLAAFTDGCQRAALRRHDKEFEPFEGFWEPVFAYAREAEDAEASREIRSLLSSAKLSDNSEDDKTLVIVVNNSTPSG